MYLIFSLVMFFVGGAMAMVIRSELAVPGLQFVHPEFFNSMTTMHADARSDHGIRRGHAGLCRSRQLDDPTHDRRT
jgi:cytochrome c oxidase subunit 1